jgi:hypothetical protein
MIVNTHAPIGTIKRTKPRRQSGEAVKNVQQGTLCLEKIEDRDKDLQRMREKNARQRMQDLEMIFRLSTVEREIAHLLACSYSSDEASFDRHGEEERGIECRSEQCFHCAYRCHRQQRKNNQATLSE